MTSPYLDRAQAWCIALRTLMNYPAYALPFHTTAWRSSSPRDVSQALELTQIAADKGSDLVHVAFALDIDAPSSMSLAVRQGAGVAWIPDVHLYAADEKAPLELLVYDRRWFIGPRSFLTSAKLPPKHRKARGEEIAWRRWQHAAAIEVPLTLERALWVPPGGTFKDAVPHERLKIAA